MYIESVVSKVFYEGIISNDFLSDCDFSIEWVAKNAEELKEKGIDPDYLKPEDLPPDEEFYYIRIWLNFNLDESGLLPFLNYLG